MTALDAHLMGVGLGPAEKLAFLGVALVGRGATVPEKNPGHEDYVPDMATLHTRVANDLVHTACRNSEDFRLPSRAVKGEFVTAFVHGEGLRKVYLLTIGPGRTMFVVFHEEDGAQPLRLHGWAEHLPQDVLDMAA